MIYILLSIISLIGKSFLFKQLLNIYNGSQLHKMMVSVFIILIAQSLFELSLYYYAYHPDSTGAYFCLLGFYFCIFYAVSLSPFVALSINNAKVPTWLLYGFLGLVSLITFLMLFTRLIIADAAYIETTRSLTRVAGPMYFLFQGVVLSCVIATLLILLRKSFDSNYFARLRSRNLCLVFIPCFALAIFLIIAMAHGAQINSAGTLAFVLLMYTAAIVHNIQPKKQPDYLVFLPFSRKGKILINALNRLVYVEPGADKNTMDEQLMDYYLSQSGLTQKEVSKLLNVSEATLSRRKKQLCSDKASE